MYGIRCQSVEVVTNNLIKQQLPVRFTFGFECFIVVLSFSGLCVLCLFMHCSRISPRQIWIMVYFALLYRILLILVASLTVVLCQK